MIEELDVVKVPKYRVHCLNNEGHITSKANLCSEVELDAVREAMKMFPKMSKEVWQGKTLIVHIDPKRTPGQVRVLKHRSARHSASATSK